MIYPASCKVPQLRSPEFGTMTELRVLAISNDAGKGSGPGLSDGNRSGQVSRIALQS